MVEISPLDTPHVFRLGYAGDTFNTAWYLKRLLGDVGEIDYFTAVGTDSISDRLLKFMHGAGIGTSCIIRRADKGLGLYMVQLQAGERSFIYWRNDSAARTLAADQLPLRAGLREKDLAYFSGITLAILPVIDRMRILTELSEFRREGGIVAFDPNLRPTLWKSPHEMTLAVTQAAAVSDIVLPSFTDEANWFGDKNAMVTLNRYASAGVGCCVVKNAAESILAAEAGQRIYCDPIPNVKVVDSTAAGDSFNAGFIAARLQGAGLRDAVQAGASLAAQGVAKRGALVETALPKEAVN